MEFGFWFLALGFGRILGTDGSVVWLGYGIIYLMQRAHGIIFRTPGSHTQTDFRHASSLSSLRISNTRS